jgi:hypothetical protein
MHECDLEVELGATVELSHARRAGLRGEVKHDRDGREQRDVDFEPPLVPAIEAGPVGDDVGKKASQLDSVRPERRR